MSTDSFVHLGVHTEYALTDSIVRIDRLMDKVREGGMGSVALTDPDNMFSVIRAQKAAVKAGIKPIIGVEVTLRTDTFTDRVTLIASSSAGYRRLCEGLSAGYTDSERDPLGRPVVSIQDVAGTGVMCLIGGRDSALGRSLLTHDRNASRFLDEVNSAFFGDSVYLKISRTGHHEDNAYVRAAVDISRYQGIPLVAVNDVRFLSRDEHESHEIRVRIAQKDSGYKSGVTAEQYLKSAEEMAELFSDIPSALQNTVEIARRATLDIELGRPQLPRAPVPEGETQASFLRSESYRGLNARLEALFPGRVAERRPEYDERLEFELSVINNMGFPGYFLIVADFIRWAKSKGIPVGPGRGSGAGSLVAYSLGITDLDPLAHGLLFERFLNPERASMPDFDIDFCMDRRDEVIGYVSRTYGREAVSQIITFGTMAARMVIRDVARAMGHPYMFGDRLAKLIPGDPGTKLRHAIDTQPDLKLAYDTDAEAREVIDHALALEGLARQVGKHAGGVLIAPGKLTDFTPLYSDPDGGGLVSQYDKDDVEEAGLVKFDFLGLRTLTILHEAVSTVHANHPNKTIDLLHLPEGDRKTFDLIQRAETAAVFQLESHGMRRLVRDLQPSNFEEIVALVALFRPGPLQAGMVDDYISRKHGRTEVRYPHPMLESVLAPTYGVFVYQEQVMEAAQVLAGYSLGEADILRKAMGKKKPEEMAKQRQIFVDGSVKTNGIPAEDAGAIFDLIETFAGYGFNKSHSAGYALLSYQTAYMKAHYPAEFMAAVLSSEMNHADALVKTLSEVDRMGLTVKVPDVNVSGARFVVDEKGSIVYGLGAIKGVGASIVEAIVNERTVNGPFLSTYDFCRRTGINKRGAESLAKAGALDAFGPHRAAVVAQVEEALGAARQTRKVSSNQVDMFGLGEDMLPPPAVPRWSLKRLLQAELESFGCFVSGHPMAAVRDELSPVLSGTFGEITEEVGAGTRVLGQPVTVAGYLVVKQVKPGRKGSFARIRMDDGTAQFEVFVNTRLYAESELALTEGSVLVIEGRLEADDYQGGYRLSAKGIKTIDQVRERYANRLLIHLETAPNEATMREILDAVLHAPPGPASVELLVERGRSGEPESIPLDASVVPTVTLTDRIEALLGPVAEVRLASLRTMDSPAQGAAPAARPAKADSRPREERHQEIEALFEAAEASMAA